MGARTWIKIFCNKWIEGTLRHETPEVRGIWIDLLALVGNGQYGDGGELKIMTGMGLTDDQISTILKTPLEIWKKAKDRLVESQRIEVGSGNVISITNWKKYQSEYQRQKPYRHPVTKSDKGELLPGVTGNLGKSEKFTVTKSADREGEGEGDRDREGEGEGDGIELGEEKPSKKKALLESGVKRPSLQPTGLLFNLLSKKWVGITEQQISFWKEAYPAVNVEQELKRMAAWLDANPTKRKSNYAAFINRWLKGEQDKGGSRSPGAPRGYSTPEKPKWMKDAEEARSKKGGKS